MRSRCARDLEVQVAQRVGVRELAVQPEARHLVLQRRAVLRLVRELLLRGPVGPVLRDVDLVTKPNPVEESGQ